MYLYVYIQYAHTRSCTIYDEYVSHEARTWRQVSESDSVYSSRRSDELG